MSVPVVLCLCACLVLVPSQAAPVAKLSTQLNSMLSQVNAGFNSLASVLRAMKKKADEDRAKLTQLTADVRRIEKDRASLPEAIKQSIDELKASVHQLKVLKGCGKGWTRRESKCYKFSQCDAPRCTLDILRENCVKEGAELASVRSAEENGFVASLAPQNGLMHLFLGARKNVTTSKWLWPDGSEVTYTNWAPNEPNNRGGAQTCLVMLLHVTNKWDDASCDFVYPKTKTGYVCNKSL